MERIPNNVPLSLSAALSKAQRDFAIADPAIMAGKSYAQLVRGKENKAQLSLPYFSDWYAVEYPLGTVCLLGDEEATPTERTPVPLITHVVLLHYLVHATGNALNGKWVSYRELPHGDTYERAFHQRAIVPLEVAFGFNRDGFVEAGLAAGGERARLGDASFFFRVLPRVPLMAILWTGDDEVSGGANIVFDGAAGAYLPGEDLAYLGIALTARMLGAKHGELLT